MKNVDHRTTGQCPPDVMLHVVVSIGDCPFRSTPVVPFCMCFVGTAEPEGSRFTAVRSAVVYDRFLCIHVYNVVYYTQSVQTPMTRHHNQAGEFFLVHALQCPYLKHVKNILD